MTESEGARRACSACMHGNETRVANANSGRRGPIRGKRGGTWLLKSSIAIPHTYIPQGVANCIWVVQQVNPCLLHTRENRGHATTIILVGKRSQRWEGGNHFVKDLGHFRSHNLPLCAHRISRQPPQRRKQPIPPHWEESDSGSDSSWIRRT